MPVPAWLQDQVVTGTRCAFLGAIPLLLTAAVFAAQRRPEAASFLRSFDDPSERVETRADILDTPLLPGSLMKAVTLVAALESHVVEPDTSQICRRVVTVEGRRYTCSHPDLKRPLTAAEALAHSCNQFFVSMAPRLSRTMFNDVRARVGLPPVSADANFAAALVGLDGPRVTPRVMLDVFGRLVGADRDRPLQLPDATRRILLEGLRGAATYGSASELGSHQIAALAKTGTSPMPGGGSLGLLIALLPPDRPRRGLVVVAPGAAGRDAASVAVDLLERLPEPMRPAPRGAREPAAREPAPSEPARSVGPRESPVIKVGITGSAGQTRIQEMPLEEYVARVVAGEGQPRAADAAQEALAIAVRTFALANLRRHHREGFDLCDTTHCQVLRPSTAATTRAAQTTAGRVLVYQNQPATIFYSAWCGGRSELASDVWPGAIDYPFEPALEDDACRDEPGWTAEIAAGDIARALRVAGLRGDRLRELRVVSRNGSGRVSRLRAEGFSPSEVSGDDFRMAVGRVAGWRLLKSTLFEMRRTSGGYIFTGRGFGHGVGLCVIGAGNRAARGATSDGILRFYYPGLRVEPYLSVALTSGSRAPAASRPPAVTATDVLVALPAGEEGERPVLTQLIRRARDEIASKAGVAAPPAIRVTVHPSVDSFGRASGQPWWVSGASDQAAIDLIPLALLQQRGLFERTIRHEVAHVLLDATLSQRPMWVREGAAFYFGDPSPAADRRVKGPCPSDEEFLRPLSAGTHRDAYARAEACFAREIAKGKRWDDIK
jgi:SpoIID/LytB domain protein